MQKERDQQLLLQIHSLASEIRDISIKNGTKIDDVHREVSRTSIIVDALRDNVRSVEHAVRERPQWLLVFAVGALLGVSLFMHALRLL